MGKKKANHLIKTLQKQKQTLALAESVTCGLASQGLSLVKGTSDVFKGGIICYSNDVKCSLLKLERSVLQKYTAESQETTDQLAKGLAKLIKADIYGAITGLANEGGSETKEKPIGTIFLTVFYKRKMHHRRKLFKGSPLTIQKKACEELYDFILEVSK